ncbi:cytochrome P450 [Mycobacterium sp. CVI_P3]|uniref:Bifunctional cytochrome P450/NADPH--P450 reductase n=1 Tax=Mycobacterium pinniadriaticum TaxID=2994102 RepID=A0ABT3SD05_9MYCO|nr:cytochrome P450 [Mycobacterium pinniadriaticum]MCX2930958.1 cytochrome P450 [Mycobacterium pinniadriaticum]MCX2937382.1 cytochrome P450 [Mycobacterium pinniadriaticum]
MTDQDVYDDVPQPKNRVPILGDALHLDGTHPTRSLMELAGELGPIYSLIAPGQDMIVVSGGDIAAECLDETRFEKNVAPELVAMREVVGDAIFTSWTQEPAWKKAHNILLPAFAPQAIKGYTEKMADIADQLVMKWARLNPGDPVDIVTDMTKLTFDTICLVCFSYRPGSFYRQDMPPIVTALEEAIAECVNRPSRLPGQDIYEAIKGRRKYKEQVSFLNNLADTIIEERIRSAEVGKNGDVLDLMLSQPDKDSGQKLDRLNIRQQMLTFLAAGYDTTSGMLMWTVYHLLKNPDVLAKCYAEVDEVFGDDLSVLPNETQIPKLQYLLQCMKEALRLWPVGAGFQVRPLADEVLGGKYRIKKGQPILLLTPQLQRDPSVFPDPERFDPDRFTAELEASRPAWAFMPFGSGQRACIGRHFSFYESQLLLGLILQRFKLLDSFDYQLDIKDFFSIKPNNLTITVAPREGREAAVISGPRAAAPTEAPVQAAAPTRVVSDYGAGNHLLVLFGSNLGTSERIATEIAEDGRARGFTVTQGALDDYVDALPTDGLVVICTSSYNGNPPDNAIDFHRWLGGGRAPDALAGVTYTVFGAGDRVWASTFQKVPAEIDDMLAAAGATRFAPRGAADASDDFDGMFRDWYGGFWPQAGDALGLAPQVDVATDMNRYEIAPTGQRLHGSFFSSLDATPYRMLENRELLTRVVPSGPVAQSTRHIEFALPEGVTYRTGDHIALLPRNAAELIGRAAALAELDLDELVMIRANTGASSHLPLDTPFVVSELLAARVELQAPLTRAQIRTLAEFATDADEQAELAALAADGADNVTRYREEVLFKRVSLLDMVQRYRSIDVPLNTCLDLLPGLAPRYYSISSSPTAYPDRCSITVGVLRAPARSGSGIYHGTSSNFLARTEPGTLVPGFIRPPGLPFDVPEDPATPMIMIATGTGLSPFRGFLQERAAQGTSAALGPALLIYGCRMPDADFIYEDEIRQFEADGVVSIVTAYSRVSDGTRARVQDAVRANADQILDLMGRGGITYVCGGAGTVAPALRDAFAEIYSKNNAVSAEEGTAWLEDLRATNHYLEDVWAAH